MKDVEIQGRLNSMIDRCLKRLLMVRGFKSISTAASSASRAPSKRLWQLPQSRLTGTQSDFALI